MKYQTFHLTVPSGTELDQVVQLFNANGMLVDDTCTVTSRGREVVIWLPSEDLRRQKLDEKPGFFMGTQPTKEQQEEYDRLYNTRA